MFEGICFQWDGLALNYGVLCMGAANGDFGADAGIVPHLNRRILAADARSELSGTLGRP